MANIFKAKTLVAKTGTFSDSISAPNIVYNTGDQTISGNKTFREAIIIDSISGNNLQLSGNSILLRSNDAYYPGGITLQPGSGIGSPYHAAVALAGKELSINSQRVQNYRVTLWKTGINNYNILTSDDLIDIYTDTNIRNNLNVVGTGSFNSLNLDNVNSLTLSGMNINITGNSVLNIFNEVKISGNPVLTGIPDVNWASQVEINSLSGSVVFLTGNQTINGLKTFTSGIDIYSGTSPQSIRIFNVTGTNSGEFGLIGWTNNSLVVGPQQTNSGILRDLTLTGNNININASGALNIFDNTNILGTLYVGGDGHEQSAISIRGIDGITKILNIRDKNGENGFFVQGEIGTDLLIQMGDVDGADNSAYLSFDQANASCQIQNANLEVNGNVKFGSVVTPTLEMYDGANGYYNRIFWGEEELTFADNPNGDNKVFGILYNDNVNGELTLYSNLGVNGTRLIFPSGKQGYIAIDSELVHKTGNETISGIKTFIGNHIISGNTTITGHLAATSKSFLINHPTQIGKKLQYGSLEGPEHGVFVRGKTNDNIITLPDYWSVLVDENSISVNLTPINVSNNIYVVDYNNQRVVTNGNNGNYYFYTVYGERKDIPKLTVEF